MDPVEEFEQAQAEAFAVHGLDPRRRFVDVPPVGRTQLLEVGEGPPVLFVIGGGAPGAMWAPLLARLDGCRRIAVDRPGFGLTTTVPHRRDTLRELARSFLAGALDALGLETVTIVANSMGAWWSTQLALAAPERVSAMVHVGCPALLLDTSAPVPMRLIGVRGLGRLLVRLQPTTAKQTRQTYALMGDPVDDSASGRAMTDLMRATTRLPTYADTWAELLHAFIRPRGQRPGMAITVDDLRRLELPLLYVWGDRDPFGGQDVGRRAAAIAPNARFVPISGGHVPWISDADAVARPIREFLPSTDAGHADNTTGDRTRRS